VIKGHQRRRSRPDLGYRAIGWMDGWMEGWMDGRMDETYSDEVNVKFYCYMMNIIFRMTCFLVRI
jgi:hypothetical protein